MRYRRFTPVIAIATLSLALGGCAGTTTHYNDARSDYNGTATVQSKQSKDERNRSTTGTGKKKRSTNKTVTKYYATLCPVAEANIPCYSEQVEKYEYQKLTNGMTVQLTNGNLKLAK